MDRILLNRADLKARGIMISNTTMLRMEAKGQMPKRRYLSDHSVVWSRAEIDEFLARLLGDGADSEDS